MKTKTIVLACVAMVVIAASVLIIPVVARVMRVNSILRGIAAQGDPISLTELGGPTTVASSLGQPNPDARFQIMSVIPSIEALSRELMPFLQMEPKPDWRDTFTADQAQKFQNALDAHPDVLPTLQAASECEVYAWPTAISAGGNVMSPSGYMETLLKEISHLRSVGRLMICGARFLASKGRSDESAMMCIDLIRLTALQDTGPTVIVYQVNHAVRQSAMQHLETLVQTTELSPDTISAIETELNRHDNQEALVHALKTERAFGIESMRTMPTARFLSNVLSDYLAAMDEQIQAASAGNPTAPKSTYTGMTAMAMQAVEMANRSAGQHDESIRRLRTLMADQ